MTKQMNVQQAMRIKTLLAERRLSITSLALKIREPYGSVANNIYDHRNNPKLRAKIAGFLGLPVEKLFGGDDLEARLESADGLEAQNS